jgi:hypothetical protein
MCELQQGATLAFSVSGSLFQILNIARFSAPIPVIDDTDVADTVSRKKCPGKLQDPQMFTITARNIGTQARPAKGVVQDLTITHPLAPGMATPEILDGSGFVVDVRTPEFGADSEARQTIEIDWQFDGDPMPTRTLAVAA